MSFPYRPTRGRIIVEAIEDPDMQRGIFIIDRNKELPQRGTVLAVGLPAIINGHEEPINLKTGDIVYFHKYAGQSIDMGEKKVLLMEAEKVFAKEEEK